MEIGCNASHLCKLELEFEALVTGPACYDIGVLVIAMVGKGSYGLVMGGRKKEIREEVLVSFFYAFEEAFAFGMLFQKLSGI
nr:hypothetical protein CFP56_51410 [Quercus suber]